jgi:hypothetical protein
VVLVETLIRIGLTVCRRCRHAAKIVESIFELHGIRHHGCSWLGRGDDVGTLVGSCMHAKGPAARGSGEPRSNVAKWHRKGGGVVGGLRGWLRSQGSLASGTQEYGFMLPLVVTAHSVGPGGCIMVIDTGLCTGGTCVVVMDVAAMGMAIVPIVEVLEWGRRGQSALGGI